MSKSGLPKGFIFLGPNGQGYRLVREIAPGEKWLRVEDIEPFGGAPDPRAGFEAPMWLLDQFQNHLEGRPVAEPAPKFTCSSELRWVIHPNGRRDLEQKWIGEGDAEVWQKVPTITVEDPPTEYELREKSKFDTSRGY